MSLFPRSVFSTDFPRFPSGGEFTPLFRLLDDYASHQQSRGGSEFPALKTFQPKFDVKETKENYELHGELPGIEQKDVSIEFTDASTLTIKGRTERHTESGTPPAGFLGGAAEQGKLTEGGEHTASNNEHYHAPTVEEENSNTAESSNTSTEVAKTDNQEQQQPTRQQQKKEHYWVSERSIGEFQRSFSFPARIDQDAVKASLKNGILSIVVPKAQAPVNRRVNIE
jgi:HSP20 family protein